MPNTQLKLKMWSNQICPSEATVELAALATMETTPEVSLTLDIINLYQQKTRQKELR